LKPGLGRARFLARGFSPEGNVFSRIKGQYQYLGISGSARRL
jgi:hypothetical protein